MYDEDKQDDTIESINENLENQEINSIKQENETLKKMVENRNQELNKQKENPEDKIKALSNVLGIDKINARIDELNQSDNSIIGKLSEVINGMNNISNAINGNRPISSDEPQEPSNPLAKMELISNLIDKGVQLYTTFKQNQNPPENTNNMLGIDQSWIMAQVGNSVKRKFELGDKIYDTVEAVLTKKTTNKVVNAALESKIDVDEPA